ncbi:hypothetical protein ZWY2020_014903 [Hordeum vulgare]|nr:hypothetical protein ZWY2020_014903 [Hordeum vulgare]
MRARGMSPESITGSLAHYARRHLSGLNRRDVGGGTASDTTSSDDVVGEQRVLLEEIVAPCSPRRAPTTGFAGMLRRDDPACRRACRTLPERWAGEQLEEAALEDLLIPNTTYSTDTLYDVDCMQRMLEQFVLSNTTTYADPLPEITADETPPGELMLASTVMASGGHELMNVLELAFDTSVMAGVHPSTESERALSLADEPPVAIEACTHAAQNERLPLRVVVQVFIFEQLRLRTTVASWFFVGDNNAAAAAQIEPPRAEQPSPVPRARSGEELRV